MDQIRGVSASARSSAPSAVSGPLGELAFARANTMGEI